MQLIRTITRIPIHTSKAKPPHIHVAVIGSDDEHPDHFDHNVRCMQRVVEDDSFDDTTLAGGVVNTMRRFGMLTFIPDCGPGCEQSDPGIIWQKTYDGRDGDGVHLIVNYSIVRGI